METVERKSEILTEVLYRSADVTRETINTENRTVELSFSSEEPVERWFGFEILSHDSGAVRLERLNNGGPFLVGHNHDDQVGVIEKASIGPDRRGRALVRFSRSARAEEIFQDVIDGIRRNISVGYIVHQMTSVNREDTVEVYRADDWEPVEISTVPIPADNTVGVGRSYERIHKTLITNMEAKMADIDVKEVKAEPVINVKDIEDKARKNETDRVREILAMGDKYNLRQEANEFISSGKGVDEFRMVALEKIGTVQKVDNVAPIGMSKKERSQYSLKNVIEALSTGKREIAAMEFEMSDECQKRMRLGNPKGIWVPMDILSQRDLTVGSATAGGNLVGEDFMSQSFIDVLRNRSVLMNMGAMVLDGLVGDIAIPSQTAATLAYWVTEGNAPTEGAPTYGQVTMTPHTVGAYVEITRKLMKQSAPVVDGIIKTDLARSLAIAIDTAGICGVASSDQPEGITQTGGIGSVVGGTDGAAPTWAHIVNLETEVSVDNADVGKLAYLSNSKVRGKLKQVHTNSTYGEIPVWGPGRESGIGSMNGYDAWVSNSVPSNLTKNSSVGICSAIIFGNFADLMLGFWGALDINVDTSSMSTSGGTRIVAFQDCDVAVRHAQSFAAMLDALTT